MSIHLGQHFFFVGEFRPQLQDKAVHKRSVGLVLQDTNLHLLRNRQIIAISSLDREQVGTNVLPQR